MSYFQKNKYDKTDKNSIEEYGKNMIGNTFQDIINSDNKNLIVREPEFVYGEKKENKKDKGELGKIVEERFFHYKVNSKSDPDFIEAGVELKATPYKINKNKTISAKERLVLNNINYCEVINEKDLETSHFWYKNKLILLVYYLWKKGQERLDYRIDYVKLFTPPEEDLDMIKEDYQTIINKIRNGKAHELSESDTYYLSACTKGANSSKRTKQPFSDILAKPRAFAYKSSYMTRILNNYIAGNNLEYESIKKNKKINNFEQYVINTIEKYKGKTFDELKKIFGIDQKRKPKHLGSILTLRMLDIKGNKAEEFEKANIEIKTIRINKKGTINEHMSFPVFKFKELVKENWEDSFLNELFSSKKFLFVVYQEIDNDDYVLDYAQFWNMPNEVLEKDVKQVWEKTKQIINSGVVITKKGTRFFNNLPKASDNSVCHVRPHTQKSYYKYDDIEYGKQSDGDQLPDGRWMTKQCFWLNKSYILSVVKKC